MNSENLFSTEPTASVKSFSLKCNKFCQDGLNVSKSEINIPAVPKSVMNILTAIPNSTANVEPTVSVSSSMT